MKYLVLGSSGLIGNTLCTYLEQQGHTALLFDIENNLEQDLRIPNNHLLRQNIENCDFVFFLAWDVGGSKYLKKHQQSYNFIQNNIKIITHTFDQLKDSRKPFLFVSSQMADMPHSIYGITKKLAEELTSQLNGINIRLWNVYGPELESEKSHVITDLVKKAIRNKSISIESTGKEQRQFLHVDDCAECMYILSNQYDTLPRNEKYHCTSFKWHSIQEIAQIIQKNLSGDISYTSTVDTVQLNQQIEPNDFILKYWQPKINIEQGILDIIKQLS